MKKYMIIAILGMMSIALNAQSKYSVGLNSGLDKSINSYYSDYYTRSAQFPDYNLGIDISRMYGEKFRVRLEIRYFKIGISQDWNGKLDGSSQTEPVKSDKNIFNIGGSIRVDYKIAKFNKFDIYLSPAIKGNLPLGTYESTKLYDGSTRTTHYIDNNFRHTLAAGAMGLLVKYNLNAHLGITLTPEYTFYMRKFYYQCVGNLQTVSVNLGVEWRFGSAEKK